MKKSKKMNDQDREITPEEALEFIDSFQKMLTNQDEPTQLISVRIPGNILRALKIKAKSEGKKYQSLLVEMLRQGLRFR